MENVPPTKRHRFLGTRIGHLLCESVSATDAIARLQSMRMLLPWTLLKTLWGVGTYTICSQRGLW
jgi:hypothetical protein